MADINEDAVVITEDRVEKILAIISDIAAKWELFAGQLSISQAMISQINRDTPQGYGHSAECLRLVLFHWVKSFGRATTYQALADVLRGPLLNENVLASSVVEFGERVKDEPPSIGPDVPFSEKMSTLELSQWLRSLGLDEDDSQTILVNKINGLVFSKMRPEHIGRLGLSMAAEILIEDILKTKIPQSFDGSSSQGASDDLPNDPIWNSKPSFAFLQLIKWRNKKGQREEIRIFRELAPSWEDVASLLGLSHAEIGIIKRNNVGDQMSSIRDTISKWLMNGSRLPNSRQYPVNWRGLYRLLDDVQQGTLVAPLLKEALTSSQSSVRRNF